MKVNVLFSELCPIRPFNLFLTFFYDDGMNNLTNRVNRY